MAVVATLVLGGFSTKMIYDYKELQRQAAACQARSEFLATARAYQNTIIKSLQKESQEQADEIKRLEGCADDPVDDVVIDSLRPPE